MMPVGSSWKPPPPRVTGVRRRWAPSGRVRVTGKMFLKNPRRLGNCGLTRSRPGDASLRVTGSASPIGCHGSPACRNSHGVTGCSVQLELETPCCLPCTMMATTPLSSVHLNLTWRESAPPLTCCRSGTAQIKANVHVAFPTRAA